MYKIKTGIEIAGAHQLELSYDSPCQNLHGHNWRIDVTFSSVELDKNGMVCDFKVVKAMLKSFIHDKLDHKNLSEVFDFNPTAENIAKWVADTLIAAMEVAYLTCRCSKVEVYETPSNVAVWEED